MIAIKMQRVLTTKEVIVVNAMKISMEPVLHALKVSALMLLALETKHALHQRPYAIVLMV